MQCEDHILLWITPQLLWISLASALFEGLAASWLEPVQGRAPRASWEEHQQFIRRLFHISQNSKVSDYVDKFSKLYDPLHYVTRIMDGLKPALNVQVAIQKKTRDWDSTY